MMLAISLFAAAAFAVLGVWQLERRVWKLALIEAVESRVHAVPASPPGLPEWGGVSAAKDQYRHVVVTGRFLHDRETLVQTATEMGTGYWVMTPLEIADGTVILVNRGFVPDRFVAQRSRLAAPASGPVRITGLLRMSEPKGRLLRANQPSENRWYSRDIAAIASARRLPPTAPYFIDADASPIAESWPRGGLTVVAFPNNHLSYAATWFSLAMLSMFGFVMFWRPGADKPHARH
ncbi:SURF1 family protein [Novosphingobium sp. BL-8A]|uniref:SURF1 family protein n=1 Tax=Novosphingobium sp. BL-8A TaxID=3127639 RepID=UPI003756FED8